jgi:hypothetical protein
MTVEHTRDGAVEIVAVDRNTRELSQLDRRARAFERVYPLLSTSIPTSQILASYRHEIDEP